MISVTRQGRLDDALNVTTYLCLSGNCRLAGHIQKDRVVTLNPVERVAYLVPRDPPIPDRVWIGGSWCYGEEIEPGKVIT